MESKYSVIVGLLFIFSKSILLSCEIFSELLIMFIDISQWSVYFPDSDMRSGFFIGYSNKLSFPYV